MANVELGNSLSKGQQALYGLTAEMFEVGRPSADLEGISRVTFEVAVDPATAADDLQVSPFKKLLWRDGSHLIARRPSDPQCMIDLPAGQRDPSAVAVTAATESWVTPASPHPRFGNKHTNHYRKQVDIELWYGQPLMCQPGELAQVLSIELYCDTARGAEHRLRRSVFLPDRSFYRLASDVKERSASDRKLAAAVKLARHLFEDRKVPGFDELLQAS